MIRFEDPAPAPYRLEQRKPRNTGAFARHPQQWYVEPVSTTAALLRHEHFPQLTCDPCCGRAQHALRDPAAYATAAAATRAWRGGPELLRPELI